MNQQEPPSPKKMKSSTTSEKLQLMNKPESILTHEAQCRPDALSSSSAKKYLGARSTQVLAPLGLARKFACNHPPHQIKEWTPTALTSSCSSPYKTNKYQQAVQICIYELISRIELESWNFTMNYQI
jgi:hypothetical protein